MRPDFALMHKGRGFTLVELVVSIVISGILMGMIAMIMGAPVETYLGQSRRNDLVDVSSRISRTLPADLQKALPRSVRIADNGNTKVLQMIEVSDVLYYKDVSPTPIPNQELSFGMFGDTFSVYGRVSANPSTLVLGSNGNEAYGAAVVTSVPTPGAGTSQQVTLPAGFSFTVPSPTNRVFAIAAPITYICNLNTGRITRFAKHARNMAMPVDETASQLNGAESSIVATGVTACSLQCFTGLDPCLTTLALTVTVARGIAPDIDSTQVIQQYALENTP